MANRWLILKWDDGVPIPNKIDLKTASVVNKVLFQQQTAAQIWLRNSKETLGAQLLQLCTTKQLLRLLSCNKMVLYKQPDI